MRRRREALGISQGRLGRHLGLTFSQIQKYEKGTNRIGAGRLYQIATFLGVAPGYFFEGLEGGAAAASRRRRTAGLRRDEVATLNEAFAAIRRRRDPRLGAGAGALAGRRHPAHRRSRS